ncbi:LysR family transcriptional regulator [Streptomyces sp. NPDC088387]|uniref:LysR family transcriptional regulator n=1 Tax=Streptomyces sp. NPDC088387 TaxID=3365859 RepID=UPI00381D0B78
MDVRQLRHFLTVADTLSFSRAAERLFMATSPLSRSIAQLESEIGGKLFLRDTRNVQLTPLGIALVPYAQQTVAQLDLLKRDMQRHVTGRPEVHVGMRSLPHPVLHAMKSAIQAAAPTAATRLHPMQSLAQIDRVLDGSLSFGLVNRTSSDQRLAFLPVLDEKSALALPELPRYTHLNTVQPSDIRDLRILIQPSAADSGGLVDTYLQAALDIEWVEHEIIGGLGALIAQGDACCFTVANPEAPWHRYLNTEGVIIRPLFEKEAVSRTCLVWRADRNHSADLGPMIGQIRAAFQAPMEF